MQFGCVRIGLSLPAASFSSISAANNLYFLRRLQTFSKTFISSIKQQPKSPVWLLYIVPTPSLNVNLEAVKKVCFFRRLLSYSKTLLLLSASDKILVVSPSNIRLLPYIQSFIKNICANRKLSSRAAASHTIFIIQLQIFQLPST